MTFYLLHWQDGDRFLGVNIVEADDAAAAQIRATELNITPGSDDFAPVEPLEPGTCPPSGRVDGAYDHRPVWNPNIEMLVCASCGAEWPGVRQPIGTAIVGELMPRRPASDAGPESSWDPVANRLLSADQLMQLGIGVPA